MDYITTYFRDGEQLSHEEWNKMLEEDIEKENEHSTWDVSSVICSDIGEGRDVEVNGHDYSIRTDYVYDTAKELLEDMIFDGKSYELIEAVKSLSEEEAKIFIKHIERVKKSGQKFILEDDEEH